MRFCGSTAECLEMRCLFCEKKYANGHGAKRKIIGTFMMLDSPEVLELLSLAGFSLICIDHEHGGWEPRCNGPI